MHGKKVDSARVEEAVRKAVNYEITVADQARRSERRAWWVAASALCMSLILAGGYFYVLPLKEKVPYLVMADAYTGQASVARLHEDQQHRSITSSEAINRANVAAFIRARESYDWTLIGDRDWKTVFTMAEPEVGASYRTLYSTRNAAGPLQVYGKGQSIRVKILSIQLFGEKSGSGPSGATVRFQRSLFDKATGASGLLDNKIATAEFRYRPDLTMSEGERELNPLGFRVRAYRVDNDYANIPVVSDEMVSPAPANASAEPAALPRPTTVSTLAGAAQ
ncbi:MAG TPA: type IV secretion system protein [Stenotrophomonas sp.]|jgi:type IV secretion system protein VirB8